MPPTDTAKPAAAPADAEAKIDALSRPDSSKAVGAAEVKQPGPHDAKIEEWFVEHFNGSIVSRSTEVYNHVRTAVDELKRRLG